jgi:hypothetical protein
VSACEVTLPKTRREQLHAHMEPRLEGMEVLKAVSFFARWDETTQTLTLPRRVLSSRVDALMNIVFNLGPTDETAHTGSCIRVTAERLDRPPIAHLYDMSVSLPSSRQWLSSPLPRHIAELGTRGLRARLEAAECGDFQVAVDVLKNTDVVQLRLTAPPQSSRARHERGVAELCKLHECHRRWEPPAAAVRVLEDQHHFERIRTAVGLGSAIGRDLVDLCSFAFDCVLTHEDRSWRVSAASREALSLCHDTLNRMTTLASPSEGKRAFVDVLRECAAFVQAELMFESTAELEIAVMGMLEAEQLDFESAHCRLDREEMQVVLSAPKYLVESCLNAVAECTHKLLERFQFAVLFPEARLRSWLRDEVHGAFKFATLANLAPTTVRLPTTMPHADASVTTGLVAAARGASGIVLQLRRGDLPDEEHARLERCLSVVTRTRGLRLDETLTTMEIDEEAVVVWQRNDGDPLRFRFQIADAENECCVVTLCGMPSALLQCEKLVATTEADTSLATCVACFAVFGIESGVQCSSATTPHFTCRNCFSGWVMSRCDETCQAAATMAGVQEVPVPCPAGCDSGRFPSQVVAVHCDHDAYDAYLKANEKIREMIVRREVDAELRVEFERKLDELKRMDALDREVQMLFNNITDLWILRCPRPNCKAPFDSFTGCFALTCSHCSCGFCALCLRDCGSDAHAHVAACGAGQLHGTYFGSSLQFEESVRARRERVLREQMATITNDAVYNKLRDRIARDAQDNKLALPPSR